METTPQVTWKPWNPVIVKKVDPYRPATAAPYFKGSAAACSARREPSRKPAGVKPCPTSLAYSTTCTPTNEAPARIVSSSHKRRPRWSPREIAANAFTIDTEEQSRRKVLKAVSGTLRTAFGFAHGSVTPKRRMMYDPISAVKNITSLARNTHMPSLLL